MYQYVVEAVKYVIRKDKPKYLRSEYWPLNDMSEPEIFYVVEYTGKGWKISPAGREHLCWSQKYQTFFCEESASGVSDEYIAACRYADKDTAVKIAENLIAQKEELFYTTWDKRTPPQATQSGKLEEIVDILNGTSDSDNEFEDKVEEIQNIAQAAGIVIVYGRSDDLIEFRGAICDELGAWKGGIYLIKRNDTNASVERLDNTELYSLSLEEQQNCIFASGLRWRYKTDIPHKEFTIYYDKPDEESLFSEDNIYCVGIVFYLKDVKQVENKKKKS